MSAITISGDLVHYEVLGRGKPVVLLHSWLGSWRYWIPTMQQLSMKYRTYALDLWGFGDSGKNYFYYSIEGQAELLERFLERMGISKAVFVGHGLGAAVLAHYAVQPQNRNIIHRMMVISPPLFGQVGETSTPSQTAPTPATPPAMPPEAPTLASISKANRERLLQAAALLNNTQQSIEDTLVMKPTPPVAPGSNPFINVITKTKPANLLARHMDTSSSDYEKLKVEVEKADENALRVGTESLSRFNPLPNLLRSQSPTLTVMGVSDTLVSIPDENILQKLTDRNQFRLILLPNTRHFPMLEDTSRFTRLLREFFEAPNIEELEMKDEWRRRTR